MGIFNSKTFLSLELPHQQSACSESFLAPELSPSIRAPSLHHVRLCTTGRPTIYSPNRKHKQMWRAIYRAGPRFISACSDCEAGFLSFPPISNVISPLFSTTCRIELRCFSQTSYSMSIERTSLQEALRVEVILDSRRCQVLRPPTISMGPTGGHENHGF